jgi:hypothetical protein
MSSESQANEPPLATLVEAVLNDAQVEQLFSDLANHASVDGVLAKSGPREHAGTGNLDLAEAKRQLLSGAVRALQVRYRFDGTEWSDTLLRVPGGVRIVRCKCDP